jgi:ATP-binding cassette subfamily F protein 3
MDQLRPQDSALLHLQRLAPDAREQELRDFLGGFDFAGDKALEPVAPFSGGEKARLALALLIWGRPNLLLLDEPTNHLDLEMRQALSEALQEFEGALVVVSHDRHLLRVTTDELLLVDDAGVVPFAGDLDDYPAWLVRRQADVQARTLSGRAPADGAAARREQRRREAEERARLQPLRRRLGELDERLTALSGRQRELERELADPELYEAGGKERLLKLLQEKQGIDGELEETEMAWLEAGEELERQTTSTR